jgi:hypothetical protein
MKTIILAVSLCVAASADILPTALFSGDPNGWNNYQPGATGSQNSPNFTISDLQAGLILPDGVTPVSFSATANAADTTTIDYVDQWQIVGTGTTPLVLNWWSSGPTQIWFDGGIDGILVNVTGPGEHSGTVDLTEADSYDYFSAYVTASDGKDSFAYNLSAAPIGTGTQTPSVPEPGTLVTLATGLALVFVGRSRLLVSIRSCFPHSN